MPVTLSNPTVADNNVGFTAVTIPETELPGKRPVATTSTDPPPDSLGRVSLFIDSVPDGQVVDQFEAAVNATC